MISLLVDYYGLPKSGTGAWPGRAVVNGAGSVDAAILDRIENRMGFDFHRSRFVPCVLMHEFEALLFSDCEAFARAVGQPGALPELRRILAQFNGPEEINDSEETAPSKRIHDLIPTYNKLLDGNRAAEKIGLEEIQSKCPHFQNWLQQLVANARLLAGS